MNILFVTPCLPSESDGRRPLNFLKHLAPRHTVHLIAMKYTVQTAHEVQCLRNLGIQVTYIPYQPLRSRLNCLSAFWKRVPLRTCWVRHPAVRPAIEQAVRQTAYDVIHIDRMRMGQYANSLPAPVLVDFPDAIAMYHDRSLHYRRWGWERLVDRWECHTIPDYERRMLAHVQCALVCSEIDAAYLNRYHPDRHFDVIYNGVDTDRFVPRRHEEPHAPRCIITGTLFYFPNVDCVRYYMADILPRLRASLPDLQTQIIGTRPVKEIRALESHPGIQLLLDVPHMEDYLYSDDIYVCPLRVAAGIRHKLLEAMSVGMPIVTTRLGAEGLHVEDGKEMLFAETPEEFTRQISRLVESEELRRTLGEWGRAYALRHYALDVLGRQLEALYEQLIADSRRQTAPDRPLPGPAPE